MRTILDQDASSRPKRRTALIARELGKYQVDIATLTLSETRLTGEGSIAEPKGGKRQKTKTECMVYDWLSRLLCRQLPDLPAKVSEWLMKLRFPLNPSRHVTVINAYAPTFTCSDEAKDAFYQELNAVVKDVLPKRQVHPAGRLQCESGY